MHFILIMNLNVIMRRDRKKKEFSGGDRDTVQHYRISYYIILNSNKVVIVFICVIHLVYVRNNCRTQQLVRCTTLQFSNNIRTLMCS